MDNQGKITKDPADVLKDGGLLYLGGAEETGGYKGYGLAMMVEILGGILGGGPFGKQIRYWKNQDPSKRANLVSLPPQCALIGVKGSLQCTQSIIDFCYNNGCQDYRLRVLT